MGGVTVPDQDNLSEADAAIWLTLVPEDACKESPDDLWFGTIADADDAVVVSGRLPLHHGFYDDCGSGRLGILGMTEVIRQAVEIASRTMVETCEHSFFVLLGVDVMSAGEDPAYPSGSDLVVTIPRSAFRVNSSGDSYGIKGEIRVLVGGRKLLARIDAAFMSSSTYSSVRKKIPHPGNATVGPVWSSGPAGSVPAFLTPPQPDSGGYRATWTGRRICFLYDRALDHVPGLMQGQLMGQLALAAVNATRELLPGTVMSRVHIEFVSFAEPDELLALRAVHLPSGAGPTRTVEVVAHQQQRTTARAQFHFSIHS